MKTVESIQVQVIWANQDKVSMTLNCKKEYPTFRREEENSFAVSGEKGLGFPTQGH